MLIIIDLNILDIPSPYRPGRRPRGFLSFMSNKNTSPVAVPPRGTRAAAQRPQVNTTRPGGKRAAPAPSTTTRTMPSPSTTNNTTTPTRATRTTTKPDFSARVTREKPSDVLALHSDPEPSTSLCTTATKVKRWTTSGDTVFYL